MPPLIRWYLKAALLWLVAALVLGTAIAGQSFFGLPGYARLLMPVYLHLFIVGWVTQLIFGVALWMFPKQSPERPRGNENIAWLIFILLNSGLVIRAVAEPMISISPADTWSWLLVLSAALQWAAGIAFAYQAWQRVKVR
jgi:hypothetical protein